MHGLYGSRLLLCVIVPGSCLSADVSHLPKAWHIIEDARKFGSPTAMVLQSVRWVQICVDVGRNLDPHTFPMQTPSWRVWNHCVCVPEGESVHTLRLLIIVCPYCKDYPLTCQSVFGLALMSHVAKMRLGYIKAEREAPLLWYTSRMLFRTLPFWDPIRRGTRNMKGSWTLSLWNYNPSRYSIPFGCKGTKNINILQAKRHKKSKMGISSSIPGHRQIEVVSSFLVIPLVRAISFWLIMLLYAHCFPPSVVFVYLCRHE